MLKTSTPRKHLTSLAFNCYHKNENLCVVHHMQEYLKRTEHWNTSTDQLFLTIQKPHKPVSRDTLRRWIKTVMTNAGTDTEVFKPHSTRAASASAAHTMGAPIQTILNARHWNNSCTFAKFSDKAILPCQTMADILLSDQE